MSSLSSHDRLLAPTSELTHERLGRILAGASVLACGALGALHSPWWLLGLVGVGINLVQSGFTNRCGVKSLLIRLGFPGERDLGRLDALRLQQGQPEPRAEGWSRSRAASAASQPRRTARRAAAARLVLLGKSGGI